MNRDKLGISETNLPFKGADIWNAYEVSWLNRRGLPQVAVARLIFPCDSLNLLESKSVKLYLNSFNQQAYTDIGEITAVIENDLTALAGAKVKVVMVTMEQLTWNPEDPAGVCLDNQEVEISSYKPDRGLLGMEEPRQLVEETVYTNLFRSNCPLTGQPDWASVSISYSGERISHSALLQYLVSYRQHNDFHENCVESIFADLQSFCLPRVLTVQANFLRRGGLDINPVRSTSSEIDYRALPRLIRQ